MDAPRDAEVAQDLVDRDRAAQRGAQLDADEQHGSDPCRRSKNGQHQAVDQPCDEANIGLVGQKRNARREAAVDGLIQDLVDPLRNTSEPRKLGQQLLFHRLLETADRRSMKSGTGMGAGGVDE